ncbi:MAG: hypothetical protein OSB70_18825, partial [Myxococcota bacterium]|nr:hypothetical protein [Myxococcota bacterium]
CDNGLYCDGLESCDALLGCEPGTPVAVDDSVACTTDSCDEASQIISHAPDAGVCDDGDPCTAEVCDQVTGCDSIPIEGCGVAVPVSGLPGALILGLSLVALGLASLRRARA